MIELEHFVRDYGFYLANSCPNDWDRLADMCFLTSPNQEIESLRKKYTVCYRKKVPTGDPNLPKNLKPPKFIKYTIREKVPSVGTEATKSIQIISIVG